METIELPDSYEETCIFLMAVEPHLVHAIWDVGPEVLEKIKDQGHDDLHPVRFILRFHDVTGTIFDGENSHVSFDVEVDLNEKKRYVPLRNAGRAYLAEIGTVNGTGVFSPLGRSNVTETPRNGITPHTEPKFALAQEVAVQEDIRTEVPPEPLSQDRLRAEQEKVPETCTTRDDAIDLPTVQDRVPATGMIMKDDVDLPVVQGRVPATAVIMKKEQEKTRPGDMGDTFSILARDVLMKANLFHRPGSDAEQVLRPGILATRLIQEQRRKRTRVVDLTEKSEKMFVAGISSK